MIPFLENTKKSRFQKKNYVSRRYLVHITKIPSRVFPQTKTPVKVGVLTWLLSLPLLHNHQQRPNNDPKPSGSLPSAVCRQPSFFKIDDLPLHWQPAQLPRRAPDSQPSPASPATQPAQLAQQPEPSPASPASPAMYSKPMNDTCAWTPNKIKIGSWA